jgi:hypothetical protein
MPPVRIEVLDAHGHHIKAGTLVSIRLVSGHLRGILARRTDKNGQVNFSGLSIARAGHYTLEVTVAGIRKPLTFRLTIR